MIVRRSTATVETLSYKTFVSFSILLRVHKIKTAMLLSTSVEMIPILYFRQPTISHLLWKKQNC